MKAHAGSRRRSVLALLGALTLLSALFPSGRGLAAASLTVTPLTWNVIGLDSNNPATGPRYFPVGVRVCSTVATTSVSVQFVWDSSNAYINLSTGTQNPVTVASLAAGACSDVYFGIDVTPNPAAYDTTRRYHVTATDASGTASTPVPRELYVEHLISQNRNYITNMTVDGAPVGSVSLVVGGTYTFKLYGGTATQGYSQFEAFINFPNTHFQVLSVSTSYTSNNSPYVPNPNSTPYADACLWENDPNSPNYRSCTAGDYKAGGTVVTTYVVKVLGGSGPVALSTLLYDFSGSSYHYNADFSIARIASVVDPTNSTIAKSFSPSTTSVNGVSALTITLTNPNASSVSGYNFVDNLPAGVTVANPPAASTTGCGSPVFVPVAGANTISFSAGTIAASSSCVITVNVTSAAAGAYNNTTQHLFVGTLDTGNTASATLTVSNAPPPPAPTCGWTLAQWTYAGFTTNPPPYPAATTQAADVATAAISVGGTSPGALVAEADTTTGSAAAPSMLLYDWPKNGPIDTATSPYLQFTVDTSKYTGIEVKLNAMRKANGPNNDALYFSTNGTTWSLVSTFVSTTSWAPYPATGAYAVAGASTTGVTYFRIYGYGANCVSKGCDLNVDDATFAGCKVPLPPRLSKAFATNPVAVNGVSRLTFTIINPNSIPLTGVTFQDVLPSGLAVATPPNAATTCTAGSLTKTSGSALTGGETAFQLTNGTLAANATCTASLDIKATTAGPHLNVSGPISSPASGTNNTSTGYGSASLTAVLPPQIAKQFALNPILAGGVATLTFVLTNPNQNDALGGVAFSDTFPSGMVVAGPANASTAGCGTPTFAPTAGAGSIAFSGGTIAAGATCTVKVDVTAPAAGTYNNTSGAVSTIVNGATVSGNTASASLTLTPPHPAIALLKQVSSSPVGPWTSFETLAAGDPVYYRFTIENIGDVPLSPVSVSDPALAGTAADPATCAWTAPLPVASPTVDPSQSCVKGPVTGLSGTHLNTATAQGTYGGTAYPSTPSTARYATTGLALDKSVAELYYTAASPDLHYSFLVTNTGFAPLPDPVTIADSRAAATCPSTTSVGDLDLFLDPGESLTCSATYATTEADRAAGSVTNTASASAGGVTSNSDSATAAFPPTLTGIIYDQWTGLPLSGATVQVTDSAGHTFTVTTGADGSYTITGTNAAPLAAGPATVTASKAGYSTEVETPTVAPAATTTQDLSLAPYSLSGTVTDLGTGVPLVGASVTVTQGSTTCTATAGEGGFYSFVYPGCALAPGPATVTATMAGYQDATATPTILSTGPTTQDLALGTADLLITKTDGQTAVQPGQRLSYVLTIKNIGSLAAENVTLDDIVPPYLAYVSDDSGVTPTNPTPQPPAGVLYRWALGTLAVGQTRTITLLADVAGTLPDGTTTLTNYAKVTTTSPEKDWTNSEVADVDTVTAHPDLGLDKTFTSDPPASPGSTVVYQLSGSNRGHATATTVTILDTLDAAVTYNAGSASLTVNGSPASLTVSYDGGTHRLTLGLPDLAPGSSYVLTYSGTVSANPGTTVGNTAAMSAAQTDDNPADNSDALSLPTINAVDLFVFKSAAAGPSPAAPAGEILYTLQYGNTGHKKALDVVLTDVVPVHTSLVGGSVQGCLTLDTSGGVITCGLGAVDAGAGGTVTFRVTIAAPLPAGVSAIDNAAAISTSSTDINPSNNSSSSTTPVTAQPDLVISKTDSLGEVQAGQALAYTIAYQNVGNQAATGVTIVDTLLTGVTYVSSSPEGTYDAGTGTVTWLIGPLAVDGPHTLTLNVMVKADALPSSVAADRVAIADDGGNGADPNPGNNTAADSDLVVAPYLVIEKRAAGPVYVGDELVYTIDWHNAGSQATGATLADSLPAGTALIAGSITCTCAAGCTPATCSGSESGGVITWSLGDLSADAYGTASFAVTLGTAAGGALQASPTLSAEGGSGSLTVTSSTTVPPTGSRPWCELDKCAAFMGRFQDTDGTPQPGWNDNPRMTAFDDTGWTAPVAASTKELAYWTAASNLSAEWAAVNTSGLTYGNFTFFRQAFCLPLNATGLSASLQLAGDDVSDIFLNGSFLGQKVGAGAAASFPAGGGIQSGINILAVQLLNNRHGGHPIPDCPGCDHSGLLFHLEAAYSGLRPFASAPAMVMDGETAAFSADPLAIGGRRPYQYKMDFGDGSPVTAYQDGPTFTHTYAGPGTYTATLTARAAYGCTGTDQVLVTVLASGQSLLANSATVTYQDAGGHTLSGTSGAGVELRRSADLSIVKTVTSGGAVPGEGVTYQIVVANAGPSAVAGAAVDDPLPWLQGVTWTCTAAGGGACAQGSGSGSPLAETVDLPVGATATYVVQGTIDPAASGTLENTATVTPPAFVYDQVPANSASTAATGLVPTVDLSVTKTSSPSPAQPGQLLTYVIAVHNHGPSDASGVAVRDTFEAGVVWTCTATAGSTCTANGSGSIEDSIYLKSGGTATYTAAWTLDPSAAGTLSNTAGATAAPGTLDTSLGNNSATDSNTPVVTVLSGVVTLNGVPQAGATVTVLDSMGHSHAVVTGADGSYTFTGTAASPLAVGAATVTATYGTVSTTATPVLATGSNTQDLPLLTTEIRGVVYSDPENTGVVQPGRLEGVIVELWDASGNVIATTATAADGSYTFVRPAEGSYTVHVVNPAGYTGTTPGSVAITVVSGTTNVVSFGLDRTLWTGVVYNDTNANGALDAGEPVLEGRTVHLYRCADSSCASWTEVGAGTASDTGGAYSLTTLAEGDWYYVCQTPPAGWARTEPATGDCTAPAQVSGEGVQAVHNFGSRTTDLVPAKSCSLENPTDNTCTLSVTNSYLVSGVQWASPALGVRLSDPLPAGMDPELGRTGGWYSTSPAGTCSWEVGTRVVACSLADPLPAGATWTVTLYVVPPAGQVTNGVTTSATGTPEINTANNSAIWNSPTAVTLKYFRALARPGYIKLVWETATEVDNLGFNVYRALSRKGPRTKLNATLIPTKVPPGSPFGAVYGYRDTTAEPSKRYFYWLESVALDGTTAIYGPAAARTY